MSGRRKKRLSASEVSAFCEQIALLLNGGIPIYEGTYILYQEVNHKENKEILKEIDTLVKENLPLYEALEKSDVFPAYMVHMVKIGETTGKLEEVMASLARYYERENSLKESIKNVIFYPVMLFAMMGVILLVLVLKILPMFQNVFYELDAEISRTSSHMMDMGVMVGKGVTVIVLVLFAGILFALGVNKTKKGNKVLLTMGNHTPYVGQILYKLGIGKFISAMSLMISSGLADEESLELAYGLIEHPTVKKRVLYCLRSIRDHGTLEASLKESRLITGINARMVSVGAKTGVLDVVFEKLSIRYDEEIDQVLSGVSAVIEAILVLALSVVVGLVLISVMFPLISIISSIG